MANIIAEFPVYDVSHFYLKSFREGGLTAPQISRFYELAIKRDYERQRVAGAMQGVKMPSYDELLKKQKQKDAMLNPDILTDEEKKEVSDEIKKNQMMLMKMFPSGKK